MSAIVIEPASVSIALLGTGITEQGMSQQPAVVGAVQESLTALHRFVCLQASA